MTALLMGSALIGFLVFLVLALSISAGKQRLHAGPVSGKPVTAEPARSAGLLVRHARKISDKLAFVGDSGPRFVKGASSLEFYCFKGLLVIIAVLAYELLSLGSLAVLVLLALLAWFCPNIYLNLRYKRRVSQIRAQMPYLLDLLSANLNVGLSLEQALVEVSKVGKGLLFELLRRAVVQLDMGVPLRKALDRFSESSRSLDVKVLTRELLYAHEQGSDISRTFDVLAGDIRDRIATEAIERGNRAPILIIAVVMLFMVPPALLIMFFPVILSLGRL